MKNKLLKFGLISGVVVSAGMLINVTLCYRSNSFEGGMVLGYTFMILALAIMYPYVKSYRDANGGTISFGMAFKQGLYVALIASTMYTAVWMIYYYTVVPDFMNKLVAYNTKQIQESGKSAQEIKDSIAEMESFKDIYRSPFKIALFTFFVEIFPIGLIVSLIVALLLKKNNKAEALTTA
ncbi:DUF4199 domain-containing protein [Mucilaginibacter pallidiroseus]|nr:DUF4199 domain-containing protein [Mucilaginibacter pallidiroseus]